VLGDVMHDAYPYGDDVFAYLEGPSAFSVSRDLFAGFEAPVYRLWGNHDYAVRCGTGGISREVSADLFVRFHDEPERQAVDVGDFRFLLLNGQLGPTWDAADPRCDTDKGSFGAEQLRWAADQLADAETAGRRSFVLSHYMKAVTARAEDPDGRWPDLRAVLAAHPPELTFAGHTHRWLDLRADAEFPHMVVAATRYDADNFWVLELTDAGEDTAPSWRIEDEGKAQWFSPCAATWAYAGGARPVEGAPETGDCGS
jgi:3',5'-cyclic AMP phosphodiesterase CpdA